MSHRGTELQLWNNNIINAMLTPYVVLQEATTMATTVDCDEHARLLKQKTTLFYVDQPHQ
jgi:hypothetical protein